MGKWVCHPPENEQLESPKTGGVQMILYFSKEACSGSMLVFSGVCVCVCSQS